MICLGLSTSLAGSPGEATDPGFFLLLPPPSPSSSFLLLPPPSLPFPFLLFSFPPVLEMPGPLKAIGGGSHPRCPRYSPRVLSPPYRPREASKRNPSQEKWGSGQNAPGIVEDQEAASRALSLSLFSFSLLFLRVSFTGNQTLSLSLASSLSLSGARPRPASWEMNEESFSFLASHLISLSLSHSLIFVQ